MKKLRLLFYCLVVLALSGCCTAEKYERHLNARLGIDENELIEQIGNPSSVYDTNEKRSLEYKYSNFFCNQYGCFTAWCTTQYMIKDGKVDRWSYNGNNCCSTD